MFAFAAMLALPLPAPALSQAPAPIDLGSVQTIAGSWSYRPAQGGSYAAFIDSARAQRLIVRCNRAARTVSIVRTGVPAAAPALSVWTSSTSRTFAARFDATMTLTADIAAADPFLDSVAFSRARFATAARGAAMVAVPAAPEVARVIEDCRS